MTINPANQRRKEPTPQEAQQDGQGAVSQAAPLNELHQDGPAAIDDQTPPVRAVRILTDDEISVLCDIGSDGVTRPERLHLVAILADRGFIATIPAGHSQRLKLTPHA